MYISEEPLSFYQKRQLDFEKQCRLLDIDINSPEAQELKKSSIDANNNVASAIFSYTNRDDEVTLNYCFFINVCNRIVINE